MTKDETLKMLLVHFELWNHGDSIFYGEFDYQINAIKEALAQPEQEPVKFEAVWDSGPTNKDYEDAMRLKRLQQLTTPPQRKPLTDEEIDKAWRSCDYTVPWEQHRIDIARAIEAAHGIKGEA